MCNAETNINLALAYGNRSAVFFELKLYRQCLNNIRLAREFNCPSEKMSKLNDREEKCLQLMKDDQQPGSNPFDYFKLSCPPNPKIPFVIDGLELSTNLKYGRHVITNRILKVGDIISIEEPMFSVLNSNSIVNNVPESNKFHYCSVCFNDNVLDLIPCDGCSLTMYCSEDCKTKHRWIHQQSECKIQGGSWQLFGHQSIATRSVFKALSIVSGSFEELEAIYKKCLQSPKTVFDYNFSNLDDPDYFKNQLKVALSLARDETFQGEQGADCFFLTRPEMMKHEKFIRKLILLFHQIQRNVTTKIDQYSLLAEEALETGVGIFPFYSLINHSCVPNVTRIHVGNKMCLIVTRPISKGEQIFDCYDGVMFLLQPVRERQSHLQHYPMKCDCEACKNPKRYPTQKDLIINNEADYEFLYLLGKDFSKYNGKAVPRNVLIKTANALKSKMQAIYSAQKFPTYEYNSMLQLYCLCMKGLAAGHNFVKYD